MIIEQYKRLGSSMDYRRERFTMDDGYARAVIEVFVRLHERGYIYRDSRLVNWSWPLQTAISDLEVEHREVDDVLYSVRYDVEGGGEIVIATVRPVTILADTGVAVHPDDPRWKPPDRAHGDRAAGRPAGADHRRRARRDRLRHGRAEGDARATIRSTSRSAATTGSRRSCSWTSRAGCAT